MSAPRDDRPPLDRWLERAFGDAESGRLGTGWLSGTASVFLGALGLGAVLVLWFPQWLSTERFRSLYPLPALRGLIQGVIALAFLAGVVSLFLRRRKVLGTTGCTLAATAALLGGGRVALPESVTAGPSLGLDWFLLNLFVLALLFVPLERVFPRQPEQGTFRLGWTTDAVHFGLSHLLVQVLSFLILVPAVTVTSVLEPHGLQAVVRAQPLWLQIPAAILVADLAQYAVHRTFHQVSLLWRFHAVHHSSRDLDWLAGSRLHVVDAVVTRGLVLVPLQLLGFSEAALYAYLVFVSFHAVFIHANVRFRLTALEPFLVTPRFHHWHHAAADEARDKNFAVHLPWLDRLFGTAYFPPGQWPPQYGIAGNPVPESYLAQLVYPLKPQRASSTTE